MFVNEHHIRKYVCKELADVRAENLAIIQGNVQQRFLHVINVSPVLMAHTIGKVIRF